MRTPSKIILLILFVVIAIGAVLIFVKTQVAPPGEISFDNQYAGPLSADIAKVGTNGFPGCKDDFNKAYHKVSFMNKEGMLTNPQADEMIMRLDTVYGNRMVAYAYQIFNSNNWPDENIKLLSSGISGLRADKLSNGQPAVSSDLDAAFRQVEEVLGNYNAAWAIARNTGFKSVADAQSKINSANTYKSKPYISNNTALVSALNGVPAALANSHYNYVAGLVGRLNNYYGTSYASYENLVSQVYRALEEYDNTGIYGGHKKGSQGLYSQAATYQNYADNYFNGYYNDYYDDYYNYY